MPAWAAPIRLPRTAVASLLNGISRNEDTRKRVQQLQAEAADLELWVSEAEQRSHLPKPGK